MRIPVSQFRIFSALAGACALFFAIAIPAAHILKPDLNLLSDTLSLYALGSYGAVLTLGFYAIAINQILLALLLLSLDTSFRMRVASSLLFFAGLGAFLVALFPTQAAPVDLVSRLPHICGAIMQFFMFPLALLFLSGSRLEYASSGFTKLTAYSTLLLFFILFLLFFVPAFKGFAFFGILEKIDIVMITAWLVYQPILIYTHRTYGQLN